MTLRNQVESAIKNGWLVHFRAAAMRHDVDVSLLLAISSRETLIGQTHLLKDWTGDHGHGRGLMQIDDRYHTDFTSSHRNDDHAANINYAAQLLRSNLDQLDDDLTGAVAAYNAGPGRVRQAWRRGVHPDRYTTGGDYSQDVFRREDEIQQTLVALGYTARDAWHVAPLNAALVPWLDTVARSPVVFSLLLAASTFILASHLS